jgi:hypothetical protein
MIGTTLQGIAPNDGDYRHAQLMTEVAQCLVARPTSRFGRLLRRRPRYQQPKVFVRRPAK